MHGSRCHICKYIAMLHLKLFRNYSELLTTIYNIPLSHCIYSLLVSKGVDLIWKLARYVLRSFCLFGNSDIFPRLQLLQIFQLI